MNTENEEVTESTGDEAENKYSQKNLSKDLHDSERAGENIKTWWERAHSTQHEYWLTGHKGPEVWKYLEIIDRLKNGARVLNIGVGMGYCTHELARLGLNVHALDISNSCLERVKDVAVCWTPDKLRDLPINYFDVAISNLVAQHMSDKDLITQIRGVCRALKPEGGVLAIQFSQNIDDKPIPDQSLITQKTGGVLRTNREFTKIVKRAGGKILRMWNGHDYPEYNSRWVFAHIGK